MDKNVVTFIILSVLIYFGWTAMFPPPKPPAKKPVASTSSVDNEQVKNINGMQSITAAPEEAVVTAAAVDAPGKRTETESVEVDNGVVKVVLGSAGAAIRSWKLTSFEKVKGKPEVVELVPDDGLAAESKDGYGVLHLPGTDFSTRPWKLLTKKPDSLADGTKRVAFESSFDNAGYKLVFIKEFLFKPDQYDAVIRVTIQNLSKVALNISDLGLTWGPGIGHSVDTRTMEYGDKFLSGALAQTEEEKVFEKPDNENEVLSYTEPKWLALRNQYFVTSLLPSQGWTSGEIRRIHRVPPNGSGKIEMMAIGLKAGQITASPKKPAVLEARLLGSHQEYSYLKSFGDNLQGVVQFSPWRPFRVLDPLAIGMLYVLNWFHRVLGNWGWALIFLTLLVKGLMFYPTMKGMVSMRKMSAKMARMQPRLETIKKMYKDDPNKLNQEMMKLYREEGVNPLGGCLPLLVQMPIFFALYGTLIGAFELRGAEFFWIWTDLSQAEKWPILALLMGSSMYLQQKMTPQPQAQMNPDQARMQKMMMNVMPIMLTGFAIFGGWPSGLLLYWTASNIFAIAQQVYVNRKYPIESPATPVVSNAT